MRTKRKIPVDIGIHVCYTMSIFNTEQRRSEMEKIGWKEWYCHLMQVAYDIACEGRDLTVDEYEKCERDGTESVVGACFADNLTDEDVDKFVKWFNGIASRD